MPPASRSDIRDATYDEVYSAISNNTSHQRISMPPGLLSAAEIV